MKSKFLQHAALHARHDGRNPAQMPEQHHDATRTLAGPSDSRAQRSTMIRSDAPCPYCDYPSTQLLELPDGQVTYCAQCGYRGLQCYPEP